MIIQTYPRRAAVAMVNAMLIIAVIDIFIVRVAAEIGLWQFHFIRALLAIPLIVGLSWLGLGRLAPQRLWAVALRSILIAIAMLFYFSALALMSIAEALAGLSYVSVFEYSVMIFGPLFAWIVFGQQVTFWQIVGIALIAMVGGIIALRSK